MSQHPPVMIKDHRVGWYTGQIDKQLVYLAILHIIRSQREYRVVIGRTHGLAHSRRASADLWHQMFPMSDSIRWNIGSKLRCLGTYSPHIPRFSSRPIISLDSKSEIRGNFHDNLIALLDIEVVVGSHCNLECGW